MYWYLHVTREINVADNCCFSNSLNHLKHNFFFQMFLENNYVEGGADKKRATNRNNLAT